MENIRTPHRRYNPLIDGWILVSPHRSQRPWMGKEEDDATIELPEYDPQCYLCPGNTRANGELNSKYDGTYVFNNDFAAILPEGTDIPQSDSPLLRTQSISGTCRVICFSPRHDLTLARMDPSDIEEIIELWAREATKLGEKYRWVQIFENRGAIMGCSNPHPHCQIWASDFLPDEIDREDQAQRKYFASSKANLLEEYVELEISQRERIVTENENWLVVVPFWATWPFETLLLPKRHIARFQDIDDNETNHLALIMKDLLTRYDKLFCTSFPYSMGWHFAPFGEDQDSRYWQLHAHFYPPLLRSATVKKFMVGYELLAEKQRDLTAETAAQRLADLK